MIGLEGKDKEQFVKLLDDWIFKNTQESINRMSKYVQKLPTYFKNYNSPLYRGMAVDGSFLELAKSTKGVTFNTHTSWSKNEDVAKRFVKDPSKSIAKNGKDRVNILIKKNISSSYIILDIHNLVMFLGPTDLENYGMDEGSIKDAIEEQEVLIKKGIKITMKDITFI